MRRRSLRSLLSAWNRFWFESTATSTLALVRIALGLVVVAWTLSLTGDVFALFGRYGIQPSPPRPPGSWGLLALTSGGNLALGALYASLLLAGMALTVGFHTRLASVVVFVCLLSFERASPNVINSGDYLIRILAFYVMLAPAGAALSVDRWRTRRPLWEFPLTRPGH